jgi:adenylate cyclase class 2
MEIEFEAKFLNINKNQLRRKLKKLGAKLVKPEFLQKRAVFKLPQGHEILGGWLRVRDEADKITLTLKIIDGKKIEDQKEITLIVNGFEKAISLLKAIGCRQKAYQENRREIWILDKVEIMIDEWPFLKPHLEVEGKSKEDVIRISTKLGFIYNQALFCGVTELYHRKYEISKDIINNQTPLITFDITNPFIK